MSLSTVITFGHVEDIVRTDVALCDGTHFRMFCSRQCPIHEVLGAVVCRTHALRCEGKYHVYLARIEMIQNAVHGRLDPIFRYLSVAW